MLKEFELHTTKTLTAPIGRAQGGGSCVVLANGCFDILHVGHLRYLRGARAAGDILVVAINDDASVARLKGAGRPLVPVEERAELVWGFECVDFVLAFSDDTVEQVLRELQPDVHAKGTDYTVETVPERSVAKDLGIRTVITGDPKNHATRDLIEQASQLR